jgi:hypothetical protein
MTRTRNHILAMSVATILVLSAFGVALPALSPIPVYAPNEDENDDNDNNNDDNNNNDNNNSDNNDNDNDELRFLIDVIECLIENNNGDFSNDVQDCIDDVIDDYFNNDNHNNNGHNNHHNA